jgi:osmotically-inducible protein OsmY
MEASVVAGVATLTGTARTQSALDAVVREVGKIAGIRKVEARVKVEPTP